MFTGPGQDHPTGVYHAEWDGSGTITWGMDARMVESGRTPDGRNYANLQVTPGSGGIYMRIDAINTADPIRNVNVWMPDYNGESFVGTHWRPGDDISPFHPLLLERLAPFDTIRTIHWSDTITSDIEHWDDRRTVDDARQNSGAFQNGIAPEYLIELANELDANLWVNMPHMADDDYVRNFATLVRDTLEPGRTAYVEWSNEVWNFAPGFEATFWVRDQTLLPENAGLSHWQIIARETERDLRIWTDVFDGQMDRIVRVVGAFNAVPWITNQILANMGNVYDAIATAPYIGIPQSQRAELTANTTPDEVLDLVTANIPWTIARLQDHANLANQYAAQLGHDVQLLTYEGGPHLDGQNGPYQQAFFDAGLLPRMYDVYRQYLDAVEGTGVDMYMHFNFIGRPIASQYGDFAAIHRMDEPLETAHKYRALLDYVDSGDDDPPINTPPTVSDIADRAINEDTSTGPIALAIGDAETAADSLDVAVQSSNPSLVPATGLVLGGSGASRTLAVTPAANQFGAATITVTVTDSVGAAATDSFVLTVNSVNDLPTISNITDRTTQVGTPIPAIGFTIGDVETAAASLVLSATSSNTTLVPAGGIGFGGRGANRTVTLTPATNQTGTSTITVTVRDADGGAASDSFVLTVTAATGTGSGLRGEYFDNVDFTNSRLVRTDSAVNFYWGTGSPSPLVAPDTFSVRWTGEVQAVESGSYTFGTYSDEGVRLRVGGNLVLNNWTPHAATWNTSSPVNLSAGQRVPIVLEYYDNTRAALVQLGWRRPGQTQFAIVPRGRLYPASAPSGGQPTVTVVASDAAASETNRDPAMFTVSRSGAPLDQPLTVGISVAGTARNGGVSGDFDPLAGSVTIPAGAASTTITVRPVDDSAAEGRETVVLTITAGAGYSIGAASSATANIADNDAAALPVLMVIANQDFCYQEYADPRAELEAAGLRVVVAAATLTPARPHVGVCAGAIPMNVTPDLRIADARAADYSAVVFVGGWGSSLYQYAFTGTYSNVAYRGDAATKQAVNQLITDFVLQDKYITAICHGVTVLGWARVNGTSPIAGRRVSAYAGGAPPASVPAASTTRWHIEQNGATMVASRSIGDPTTAIDDVLVDGKLITAENYESARQYGRTIADYLRS
jgi:putative intracellular protease/amidase